MALQSVEVLNALVMPSPIDAPQPFLSGKSALEARKQAGGIGSAWHGDVFKTVFVLHDFFPMLSYATLNSGGNQQTLIWREPRRDFRTRFDSLEQIAQLGWDDFEASSDLMEFMDEAAGIKRAAKAVAEAGRSAALSP